MIKTRRGQKLIFGAGVVVMSVVMVWEFREQAKEPEVETEPLWTPVAAGPEPSVDWVQFDEDVEEPKSVFTKVFDGYEKLRSSVPAPEAPSEPVTDLVPVIVEERGVALAPLIKYELTGPVEESGEAVEPLDLPIGTMIYARMIRPLDSRLPKEEQPAYAELVRPLIINAKTILPSGTRLLGELKSMSGGRATFSDRWRVVIDGQPLYSLEAMLQERDFDPRKGRYGSYDGVSGLRMEPVEITHEPEVHGAERLFDEIIRPIVVERSQDEILRQLELPSLQDPWSLDGGSGEVEVREGFFLLAGAEFYLQVF
ncbi:MAG: hypothetical protein ACPGN3_15930 [Opitutales bacterium]